MELNLQVGADLTAAVQSLTTTTKQHTQQLREAAVVASTTRPVPLRLVVTATADTDGNAVLAFPVCPQGRHFILHRLTVGGQLWSTTLGATPINPAVSGQALVMQSSTPITTQLIEKNGLPTADVINVVPTLPGVICYGSKRTAILTPGESLVVVASGVGAGTYVVASAAFDNEPL